MSGTRSFRPPGESVHACPMYYINSRTMNEVRLPRPCSRNARPSASVGHPCLNYRSICISMASRETLIGLQEPSGACGHHSPMYFGPRNAGCLWRWNAYVVSIQGSLLVVMRSLFFGGGKRLPFGQPPQDKKQSTQLYN